MKKHLMTAFWLILFAITAYFGYKICLPLLSSDSENISMMYKLITYTFVSGMALSALIFRLSNMNTANSLNIYKRELEKESIDKTESSSRIKVLESKIQVLEKALDEALKK